MYRWRKHLMYIGYLKKLSGKQIFNSEHASHSDYPWQFNSYLMSLCCLGLSSGASCGKTSAGSRDVAECGLWGPLLVMAVAKDIITNVLRSSLLRFIKDASGDQCPGDGDEHVTSFISDFSGFLCWLPGNKLQFFCQRCFFNYTDSKTDLTFDGFWASQVALAQFALRHSWAGSQCRIGRASDTAGIGASHSWIQTWAFRRCRASNDVDDTS